VREAKRFVERRHTLSASAQYPRHAIVRPHGGSNELRSDTLLAMALRDNDHRDVAVGDVVCKRAQKTDHLLAVNSHQSELRVGNEGLELRRIINAPIPAVSRQQCAGLLKFDFEDGADQHPTDRATRPGIDCLPNCHRRGPLQSIGLSSASDGCDDGTTQSPSQGRSLASQLLG